MFKFFSITLIAAGLILTGYGGYQYFSGEKQVYESMAEAKSILMNAEEKVIQTMQNQESSSTTNVVKFSPEKGEVVGILSIPSINLETPIIEGTDEDELEKGVGHFAGSAYPTQNDQIVLSGHRDTVFRKMKDIEIGDIITVKLPYGDFSYKIESTKIVDAEDRTIIKSTAPDEVLVVSTCYPFNFVGDAPERFVVFASPVVE
ncbi:class D sortase [Bacillus sp. DJP31]|uniref:class D sortase n=1 Tax=Bacillus sp. DJP31 TaxID=3409789 RepID=UPI003BB56F7D